MGDIATEIYSGNEVTKAQLGTGDYPAIRYSELFSDNTHIESCLNLVNPNLIQNRRHCEYGDLLISKISENERDIGKSATYLGSEKPIVGNNILLIKHKQNPKFLAYILTTKHARKQLKNMARPSTVFCLYPKHVKQLQIPLPPRHIQDLIVDYLDNWTNLEQELEKELEKELADRKKQYQHYKELILTSEKDKWEG